MSAFNIEKQVEYWKTTALSDFETAELLIKNNKFIHGLFFCHLTIEKLLKANFVKCTEMLAPKTHDLIYLMEKTKLSLTEEHKLTLVNLMKYQIEGRYPYDILATPSKEITNEYLNKTEELLEWLVRKL